MSSRRAASSPPATLELVDAREPRVAAIWAGLERKAAPPYFLTWGWMSNWIACLPPDETPQLAKLSVEGEAVAAFFLGRRRVVRHRVLTSRALFLNTTGLDRWDELTIEHNAVLAAPEAPLSLGAIVAALPSDWDEIFLPALSRTTFPGNALDEEVAGHVVRIDQVVPSPFVDLAKVRAAPDGYLGLVSYRTRKQIRRAERDFGAVTLEAAADVAQALAFYGELVDLHGRNWRARGLPGAFADPWFDAFHRRLIADRFGRGEIQLLRLRSGSATIGCLYSLISAGRVLCYQTGFASFEDPHLKPGYLGHAEAVRYNAAAGHASYDLLGGDSRYKLSLATDEGSLVWARLQRRRVRFVIEERLRRWKRALRRKG
jgi:CelD/BcsL family acetyltransferase involved in cellulose biosynthesis